MNTRIYHNSTLGKLLLSAIACIALTAGIYFALEKSDLASGMQTSYVHVNEQPKCNICVVLDPAHGGITDNQYQTQGKQSPVWPDGLKIYEGKAARIIASKLEAALMEADIDVIKLHSDPYDYTNIQRAERLNQWLKVDSRIIFLSLHHNAQPTDKADYTDKYGVKGYLKNGATGIEIFTTPGKTKSDLIATYIYTELTHEFPEIKFRCDWKDGDADKEANFTVLAASQSPAVLIELLFMTTYSDCLLIADDNFQQRYIKAIVRAFVAYNQSLNN